MTEQLIEMAKDIAYALQQDERFVRTQMAQAAADEDEALQDLIGEFNLKRLALTNEANKEGSDSEKMQTLNEEVREAYARLMDNENMHRYQESRAALDAVVQQMMRIITMAAQGEDPEEAAKEPTACSGSCSSCGGCH